MTSSVKKHDYDLIFKAHKDGTATVESLDALSGKPMQKLHFAEGGRINIRVLGPDDTPSSMESVQVDFKVESAPTASPLGDGAKPDFVWYAGEHYTHTVNHNGLWKFGAVLLAKDGKQYTLPDPEFQVGDGVEDSHGKGHHA